MDDATFWALIDGLDWRHEGNDDLVTAPVVEALTMLPLAEIESFEEILAQKLHALDGRAWAREIGSGWWGGPDTPVSVDGFLYSRCVVVANGQAFYETVLADPREMPKDMEFEVLLSIGRRAWLTKTGEEPVFITTVSYETFSNLAGWPPAEPEPVVESAGVAYRPGMWTKKYKHGKVAVRRVIKALITGELTHPVLDDHLGATGRTLAMTPGNGVVPPPEPEPVPGVETPLWRARIKLWTSAAGEGDRQPSDLVAVIDLRRISALEVRGTLVGVEAELA